MAIDETKVNAIVIAADSRYVKKEAGKVLSSNDFTNAEKTKLAGLENTVVDSALDTTSTNPVQNKKVAEALNTKADAASLATVATSGSYNDLTDTPTISELGADISVEKQASPDSNYSATYVIKQNGVQVGSKINVPKDFLVKSASVETVATADSPVSGYEIGDKYIDFVINTVDNDETAQHLYLLVTDLVDVYNADESTITLENNTFSIKTGGVTLSHLATSVQTSLGYADNWNNSPAKNITSANITSWNAKSDLTEEDVEDTVEAYLDAITTALGQ